MKANLSRLVLSPIAIFIVIFGVLAARSWHALLLPELAVEDGRDMLAFYFNSPNPSSALRFYNGYAFIIPDAIAWLVTRGPITFAPYLFTFASLGFAAIGMFMVSRPQFEWLIPNAIDRALIALLLAVLPLGRGLLIQNLAYSLWSLLFLLIVLLAYPLPKSNLALLLRSIAIILCILSHPLAIVVVPICVIHVVLAKGWPQKLCAGSFILAAFLYQVFGVNHTSRLAITLGSFVLASKLFLTRVLFEMVSGAKTRTALLSAVPEGGHLLGFVVLWIFVFLTVTGSSASRVKWATAMAVLLMFGVVFASVAARISSDFITEISNPHLQRYFYVPKLVIAVLLLSQVIPRVRDGMSRGGLLAKCVILVGVAIYLLEDNRVNNYLYSSSLAEGQTHKAFLTDVESNVERAEADRPYASERILRREDPWSLILNVNNHVGKIDRNSFPSKNGN